MTGATDTVAAKGGRRRQEIASALRAQWRMITSVKLRRRDDGEGFEATLWLDPIVVKGSFEQQGYPRTSAALTKIESRRRAALAECVRRVNEGLPQGERIHAFSVID